MLAAHVAVEFAGATQLWPHIPQLVGVDVRSVSQPLAALPSQFPWPARQVKPQVLTVQVAVANGGGVHELLQAPQLSVFPVVAVSQPTE